MIKHENKKEIFFAVWLINQLARAWNMGDSEVYKILEREHLVGEYILECYDVLHTQGREYLVAEITDAGKEQGWLH